MLVRYGLTFCGTQVTLHLSKNTRPNTNVPSADRGTQRNSESRAANLAFVACKNQSQTKSIQPQGQKSCVYTVSEGASSYTKSLTHFTNQSTVLLKRTLSIKITVLFDLCFTSKTGITFLNSNFANSDMHTASSCLRLITRIFELSVAENSAVPCIFHRSKSKIHLLWFHFEDKTSFPITSRWS